MALINKINIVIMDFHRPIAGSLQKSMNVIQYLLKNKDSTDRGRVEA